MSANTACTILFQDGLTAAEATGAFDIAYCLPIYDNRTDGDVMQSPVENSASETADAADPSDFHGFAFPKLSSGAYSLVEWSESTEKVVAYAADSGWAILPPYSQEVSVDGYDAVGALNGSVYKGATLNEGNLTGTPGTYDSLSSWSPDDLYKSVVYLGSKENDGGWKSAYGIHLTCRDPNVSSNAEFVPGGIRFNKVLVFQQGTSGVVPVAMVCLPSPVVIAANVAGVANSITINFNFGYDTTLTPQTASFDNTYWSKLPDTSESVVPLYTPSRVVIGGSGADEVVAGNAAITIYEAPSATVPRIAIKGVGEGSGTGFEITTNYAVFGTKMASNYYSSVVWENQDSALNNVTGTFGTISLCSNLTLNGSHVSISDYSGIADNMDESGFAITSSFVSGDGCLVSYASRSLVIAEQTTDGNEQSVNARESILVGNGTMGITKLRSSIVVGNGNYNVVPVSPTRSASRQDVLRNSLIVGDNNVLGRSASSDIPSRISAKPIVILGHDNVSRNDQSYIQSSSGKYSLYLFGSGNTVAATPANEVQTTVYSTNGVDVPRFVFGNGANLKGWKWTFNEQTYGDTEYNHVFDFVVPQHALVGTDQFTDPRKDVFLGGDNAGGISVGFIPSTSTSANKQCLVIDTHYIAATTSGNVSYGGMRFPHYDDGPITKNGLIYCMDSSDLTPGTFSDFLDKLATAAFHGYFPLLVKMPTT